MSDFRAKDEALRSTDSLNGGHNFVADKCVFTGEIKQRDGLERLLRHQPYRIASSEQRMRESMLDRSECDERRWTPV